MTKREKAFSFRVGRRVIRAGSLAWWAVLAAAALVTIEAVRLALLVAA